MINLSLVATVRPEILRQTIDSFKKFVITKDKFYVSWNIDCTPKYDTYKIDEMLKIVSNAFGDIHFFRITEKPNFANAVITCWQHLHCNTSFTFHLEDDWIFIKPILLDSIINDLTQFNTNIKYVRFPKIGAAKLDKVALQPSLWKTDTLKCLAYVMTSQKDPEKQLRFSGAETDKFLPTKTEILDWQCGPYCDDIGRAWAKTNGAIKWNKNNSKEITWTFQN